MNNTRETSEHCGMEAIVKNTIDESESMSYVCRLKGFNRAPGKINGSIQMST